MKLFFPLVLLIIEGKSLGLLDSNIHPHCIKGALVNLIVCWQIPILFSQDLDETALLLWLIGRQQTAKKRPFFLQKRKPKTSRFRQQAHILGELPGIGLSLSFRLLKYFGTVEKAMIAGEEELRQIRGIGPTKARKIKELITNCDHFNTSDKTSENKVDTHGLSPWNSALWVFRIFYQQAHKGRSGNPKG
jgi:ERCC4-type nuclease